MSNLLSYCGLVDARIRASYKNLSVQEANFLVEDNLGLLVQEECTEDERKLFKLDSILTAIGLQGEEAVFDVLKQHERNPSKVKNFVPTLIKIFLTIPIS